MIAPLTLSPILAKSKGEVKRLRLSGYIPVSIQHQGMETQHYQQLSAPLHEHLRQYGDAALVELLIQPGNRHQRALVHSVQRDPITRQLMQATFQQVRLEDTLKTHAPLLFVGKPLQLETHDAMVQHQLHRLDIECAQGDLPEHIVVDVTHLMLGGNIRVSDLPSDPRYKILTPADAVLASLTRTARGASTQDVTTAEAVKA